MCPKTSNKGGRAPIAELAKILNLSRGMVQNRLSRLLESGAVLGFTISVREDFIKDTVRTVMLIEVEGKNNSQAIRRLRGIPELNRIHTINGSWDLDIEIRADNLAEFDRLFRDVRGTAF